MLNDILDRLEAAGYLSPLSPALDATTAPSTPINGAACDSRVVSPGNIFICKGQAFKPRFLGSAIEHGASVYMCDEALYPTLADSYPQVPAIVVTDVRPAMALVSAEAFGHPDRDIDIVGITGTKGKSTVTHMLQAIARAAGHEPAIVGSIATDDGVESFESHNTTPESPDLWRHISHAKESGRSPLVLEVSSHGLKYNRVDDVHLVVGCFLNFGRDHISGTEHTDEEDYFRSKLRIFDISDTAVVNTDTARRDEVLAAAARCPRLVTVNAHGHDADYTVSEVSPAFDHSDCIVHTPSWDAPVRIGMGGLFNVDNALAAIAIADVLGIPQDAITEGLSRLAIPGRMELIGDADAPIVGLVDFAHNEMSFTSLFESVTTEFPDRYIVAVFGAPGDKAPERRHELPDVACRYADYVIYTEDDPAHEELSDICDELVANTPTEARHEVIFSRPDAVARAVELARDCGRDAIVMVLAKGNETRQHVGDDFVPSTPDSELVRQALGV